MELTGSWAGIGVGILALVLLLTPAKDLYRKRSSVIRRARSAPPAPRWAVVFFRVLGFLLLTLAAALLWPAN